MPLRGTPGTPGRPPLLAPSRHSGQTQTANPTQAAPSTTLGTFLVDGKGMTLYLYTKDTPNTSNCYDKCATAWPPLLTTGAPVAGDGLDALAKYQQESPQLVLLDVNMPGMDGLEILAAILAQDPKALVVMMTSLVNRQTVEECLKLGATSYIRKDTPKEAILAELSEVIRTNLTES